MQLKGKIIRRIISTLLCKETTKGRPKEQILSEAFLELCKIIEESYECQFTTKELKVMLKNLSDEKTVYTEMHLKKFLQENFKKRIIISIVNIKKNVLWLSDNLL